MFAMIPLLLSASLAQEPDLAKMVAEAKLTLPQAVARALEVIGKGAVTQAELEFEKAHTVWSCDVAVGDEIEEVLIDAKDGSVVARGEEDEDNRPVLAAAKLTLVQGVEAAQKGHAGVPVFAQLHLVEGAPVVTVGLFAEGKRATFEVAAVVGGVVHAKGAEEDEEEEGDEADEDEAAEEGKAKAAAEDAPKTTAAFTATFGEELADLATTGRNPFFVLEPGYTQVLEGEEHGKPTQVVIRVLDETQLVGGIAARVVEERETSGGKLTEVTRDYYVISKRTNCVYYLGEDVDEYENGAVKSHGGSWLHGKSGAVYGMMMPGVPLLGARFQQETAPGVAMDRAEITGLDETFTCPAGTFEHVMRIRETTPLEAGNEEKLYAPGVGLLLDGGLKLVRHGKEAVK